MFYSCSKCSATFNKVIDYDYHRYLAHGLNAACCPYCGRNGPKRLISKHISVAHSTRIYVCDICGWNGAEKFKLSRHMATHKENSEYKVRCDICKNCYANADSLARHRQTRHLDMIQYRQRCSTCFQLVTNLTQHRAEKHERQMLICPDCGREFEKYNTLCKHRQRFHEVKLMKCAMCDATIRNKTLMKEHMRIHRTEKQIYSCDQCNRMYQTKESLNKHVNRVHTKEKQFYCACGKICYEKASFLIHQRAHSAEKPFICNRCNKGYRSPGTLYAHRRKCTEMEDLNSLDNNDSD